MSEVYKYNKEISRFYDVVYENIKKDFGLEFYLKEISAEKGPVLEIGSGTGRIFVPALQSGADIYGIDQSEMMTSKLKEKISEKDFERVSIQDAREFSIVKKFKLIIAPFRMFSHLITVEDQLKALGKIYEHLDKGGRFIFDVFIPDYKNLSGDVEDIL
ncbi:MAG: class I SAM-dependent methyltransferase, partial [Ignavibacteria bacterium]